MNIKSNEKYLLVVEDDEGLQRQLKWTFSDHNVVMAANRSEAVAAIRRYQPPVITLDLGLPPDPANVSEGFSALQEILSLSPDAKVIVITGNDDRDNAVKAIGMGAYDFYQKPIDPEIIKIIIQRAYQVHQLEDENRSLHNKVTASPLEGLITANDDMLGICRTIEKIAPTDATTLLTGESGTGKEILARALHDLSNRNKGRFIAINCAAIPETLLESELFGYEKGAFTGADKQTIGKIEIASGGTLFLDEIGDLPQLLQAKLLRFLQERVIERVGGRKEISVDVRIISATHRDIKAMISDNEFREDLFYRLSEITIDIPPLRERGGDIVLLAKYFLDKHSGQVNKTFKGFSQDALMALECSPWPGNVRELESAIKRVAIMCESKIITAEDLGLSIQAGKGLPLNLREVREKAERDLIKKVLLYVDGNVSKAAEILGVSRPTLYDLMNKYDLK